MNYNGYNPYYGYQSPYQTPNYQAPQQQMQFQQSIFQQPQAQSQPQPQSQIIGFPLLVVPTLDDVKKYIVGVNQVVYLKSNDIPNVIFKKITDATGNTTLTPYDTTETKLENLGKPKEEKTIVPSVNPNELAFKSDLLALQQVFEDNMSKLSTQIENALKQTKTSYAPNVRDSREKR